MSQQPTLDQLFTALERADAAGDETAAREIAAMIREEQNFQDMQANPNAPLRGVVTDEGPSTTDTLAAAVQNTAAGAVQGIVGGVIDFPLDVADTVNSAVSEGLRAVGVGAANALGYEDEAAKLNQVFDRQNALRSSRARASDLVEQASPTPQGHEAARFTSQLLGGFAIPSGKTAPRVRAPSTAPKEAAERVIDEGAKRGVRVMTSDVKPPRGFTSKIVQATGERIPYAGTGGARVAQAEERVQAVRNFAREFGVEGGENYIEDVAADFVKTRGQTLSRLSQAKNSVIEGVEGAFQSPKAIAEIDRQVERLTRQNIGTKFNPIIKELQDFRAALSDGRSLADIEVARKALGEAFEADNLANIKKVGQDAVNAIYAPLRDDMGDFIQTQAGPEAFKKWSGANKKLAGMAGELSDSAFKRVLNGADMTPEKVSNLLFSKNASEVRRLYRSLSASGRNKAKSAVVARALQKGVDGDDLSPAKFRSEIERLGSPIGVVFDKTDQAGIEGLSRLLKATQRASVASAAPPTGVQNTQIIGATVLTDMMGGMGAAVTSGTLAGFAARLYESAPVRNLMVALSKTKPGSKAEGAVIERIEGVIASQAGLRGDDAARAVNDNVFGSAVAEDGVPEE